MLFDNATDTACGTGQSASGPFYCPPDQRIFIDLRFYRLMKERFQVEGEFAQAYVIAHEVGHHVQHQLGLTEKVDNARRRGSDKAANAMSVRLELQADCFAGVWAYHGNALQRQSGGRVVPDSFTHGTSEQRARWFTKGLQGGSVTQCDSFAARQL